MKNMNEIPYKIYLTEQEMPKEWYNVRADMKKKPAPLLNPGTGQPMTAEELNGVFCEELVKQELNNDDRYIEIPKKIRDFWKKSSAHRRRSTTNTKATTPAAATSSTPRSHRRSTRRIRVSKA